MSRKHTRRKVYVPMPPRGLRPKLAPDQVLDLSLVHHLHLDQIATGLADVDTLWQSIGGTLTWSRIAEHLGLGVDEMEEQMALWRRVQERYSRTGRVGFTGEEYQLAKRGVEVMDQLAATVDRATAVAAAEWSEAQIQRIAQREIAL